MLDFKAIRNRLGVSQEEMARKVGVSVWTWRRWEKGKIKPSSLATRAIEEMLGSLASPSSEGEASTVALPTSLDIRHG